MGLCLLGAKESDQTLFQSPHGKDRKRTSFFPHSRGSIDPKHNDREIPINRRCVVHMKSDRCETAARPPWPEQKISPGLFMHFVSDSIDLIATQSLIVKKNVRAMKTDIVKSTILLNQRTILAGNRGSILSPKV